MFRFAENLAHSRECGGKVRELEPTKSTERRFVCLGCHLVWREEPIPVRGDCSVSLVNDDAFLRAFFRWNATEWFHLAQRHSFWCTGKSHEEIIGGRLVHVCFTCGAVWEDVEDQQKSFSGE